MSDRQFRFDYLDERIRSKNSLSAFAYLSNDIPKIMTRLQSVADSASKLPCPLVVMDTAPAAVLGAGFDPVVSKRRQKIICNVGNFHTLGGKFQDPMWKSALMPGNPLTFRRFGLWFVSYIDGN